ncbi:MAG TPA: hypothetical protein VKI64_02250 [Acidimicrobiales bacterium]|nr:hypothetical protein [Acidimicrobiales bacterium]
MAVWVVLSISGTLGLLLSLLVLSAWVEERILSPEALVSAAMRSRRATPEQAEALAAQQLDQVMPERVLARRLEAVQAVSRS